MRLMAIWILSLCFILSACSSNDRAKNWGGTTTVKLAKCERLDNVTWKNTELWFTTHEDCNQSPRKHSFKEDSRWGLIEGTVIFEEQ